MRAATRTLVLTLRAHRFETFIVVAFMQRYLVRGISLGAVKG
jgi:ABC-type maltose transport system permease subunit